MPSAYLPDRGVIQVRGDDAMSFLQGLVTCDVEKLEPGEGRLGALLMPQGKILFDFIVLVAPAAMGGGFLLDVPRALVADLAKRLGFYKLRAKVVIEDRSQALAVAARWNEPPSPQEEDVVAVSDARYPALGERVIGRTAAIEQRATAALVAYHAHRIALGVPEGGKDFIYGDTFPHEADMDQLGGVDFDKGCYVGQEVVSRMEHRGTARSRIVPVVFTDGFVPPDGIDVMAGEKPLGKLGSAAAGRALALLRLDRVADALAAGQTITAGGLALTVEMPPWARFALPGRGAGAKAS